MSAKHVTEEPQQAAEWGQGINNRSTRKPKKAVDPNSGLGKLAAKKYEEERLKVRKILIMAVSQAHKDELAEFEAQVFGADLPSSFFSQNAKLDPANYGEMAMLPPSNVDFIDGDIEEEEIVFDLSKLSQYATEDLDRRLDDLANRQELTEAEASEFDTIDAYLKQLQEVSNACSE